MAAVRMGVLVAVSGDDSCRISRLMDGKPGADFILPYTGVRSMK
jgi:hypothetical protein